MTKQKNYQKTLLACYLGFVTQAISANFTPLLFLTFKDTYGITLDKIAMIPLVFYLTQLLVDLAATKFADKIVVLQHGRITECGSHRELIEKKGYYAKMVALQTGEEV